MLYVLFSIFDVSGRNHIEVISALK